MKEFFKKLLTVILWCVGFPVIIIVLGVFMWADSLIGFIND